MTPKPNNRTQRMLRMERRAAGVCQSCGDEPPKAGFLTCQNCMNVISLKRKSQNEKGQR